MDGQVETHYQHHKKRDWQKLLLLVLCILLLVISVFFFIRSRQDRSQGAEQKRILTELRTTIQLPEEDPLVVTVSDKSKLTNQSLASQVENQDTLYIFSQSKRLLVYRPNTKKIIDVLTFVNQADVPTQAGQGTTTDQTKANQPATNQSTR